MMATAPCSPCCRPGETIAEGGTTISSYSEMKDGFSCDVTDATTGAKTFIPLNDDGSINVTACGKLESGLPDISKGSVSQTICPSTGYMQFRGVAEKKDDFPSHLQGTFPDANWPWVQTMEKCCVPSEWAESNGIYQSQLPDFKALYPNVTGHRQYVSVLQPKLCAEYGVIDAAKIADYIFTAFFTFECVVKILAMGFILDKGPAPTYALCILTRSVELARLRSCHRSLGRDVHSWRWVDSAAYISCAATTARNE